MKFMFKSAESQTAILFHFQHFSFCVILENPTDWVFLVLYFYIGPKKKATSLGWMRQSEPCSEQAAHWSAEACYSGSWLARLLNNVRVVDIYRQPDVQSKSDILMREKLISCRRIDKCTWADVMVWKKWVW